MKLIRYQDPAGEIQYAAEQPGGTFLRVAGNIFEKPVVTREVPVIRRRLAPVVPRMIWCVGQNYRRHADEVGMGVADYPVLFTKGVNSVQDPGEPILLPETAQSAEVDYEGELVVVIGKTCRNVSRDKALDYVAGYTCGNDVSARDWQLKKGGGQWCRGKSFDTFAPLGPCLVTPESLLDPSGLQIQTLVNGRQMQNANTREMIHGVPPSSSSSARTQRCCPGP